MKIKIWYPLLLSAILISCGKDEGSEAKLPSNSANLLQLDLQVESMEYSTIIDGTKATSELLPFPTLEVSIKSIEVSEQATVDLKVGDVFEVSASPIPITVRAEDQIVETTYHLTLSIDQGLLISPNLSLDAASSYALQSSDVYVDGSQITADFERSYLSAYADYNSDGHTDVLLSGGLFKSYEYGPIYLYLGNGEGVNADFCECKGACSEYVCSGFTLDPDALPEILEGLQHPRKILTGDYNNDGKIDAFLIGHGYDASPFPGESPILLLNNGNDFTATKLTNLVGFYHGGSSADIDNDGDLDIVLTGSPSELSMLMLINHGNANFSFTTDRLDDFFVETNGYYTAEFIDVDQDGYMDLLVGGNEHEEAPTYVLWGNSSGKYFKSLSTLLPEVENFKIVVDFDSEDIDNDGDRDLILSRVSEGGVYEFYERYSIQVIENIGNRNFSDKTSERISNQEGNPWRIWIHMQDLDNDGDKDIYYEGDHSDNLKWLNDGSGIFTKVN